MQWQKVRIKLDDHDKGEVWIDDKQLAATVGVEFCSQPGLPPLVTIRMFAEVEYEGAAVVEYERGRWMKVKEIETGEVSISKTIPKGLITPESSDAS